MSSAQPLSPSPIPSWIRVRVTEGENFKDLKQMVRSGRLHTVCEEARCPNIGECWQARTATFSLHVDDV